MAIIKCKMCGGDLVTEPGRSIAECEYCGTAQTLPRADDEVIRNLFNRANNLRIKCEFDKAELIYERIVQLDAAEAEAHWGIVLCKYGIEYVEDPMTCGRIPTCHRTSFEAVTADADYLAAVANADAVQRQLYEAEAKTIDSLQRSILSIVRSEKPFDVFICYKQADENGRRTPDSAIANDIYHQLTQEGLKVFYAAITLEDKLGQAYEPYIFAALNSAKVMLVIGTKPEYFTGVWVKNEWSRFLKLMKRDRSKLLIPCYRDMDAYDLPEEFSHLQAQDMGKIGFISDVVRGIRKVIPGKSQTPGAPAHVPTQQTAVAPLLKRVTIFLEDGDWSSADEYCEKVLDQEPENALAYVGKLMARLQVHRQADLAQRSQPFADDQNYQKALRYADPQLKQTLQGYIGTIHARIEQERQAREHARLAGLYAAAKQAMEQAKTEGEFRAAAEQFRPIGQFEDAAQLRQDCLRKADGCRRAVLYQNGTYCMGLGTEAGLRDAVRYFSMIPGHEDADALAQQCREQAEDIRREGIYAQALALAEEQKYQSADQAARLFASIPGYKDADIQARNCYNAAQELAAAEEAARIAAEEKAARERRAAQKRRKRNRIIMILIAILLVLGIAFAVVYTTVIVPGNRYDAAAALMEAGDYAGARDAFLALEDYKDSAAMAEACRIAILDLAYQEALNLFSQGEYEQAIQDFTALNGYLDSDQQIHNCRQAILERNYQEAELCMRNGEYQKAYDLFTSTPGYRDAEAKAQEAKYQLGLEFWNARDYERSNAIFTELGEYKDSLSLLHTHEYEGVIILEPGCETLGEERFDCVSCDHYYTAPVVATGHMYEETVVKAAGCTSEGEAAFTCKCGKTYNETIAPTGHSYNDGVVTTYATCESNGVRTYSCRCGDSYTETIGAIGHDYTTASCTTDSHCMNCGHVREVAYGHTTTTGVCSRCGYNFTAPLTFSGSGRYYNGTDTVYHTFTLPKGKYRATITVNYRGGGAGWDVGMDGPGLLYFGYGSLFESGTFTCDFDMYYDTTGDIRVTIDGSYTLTIAPINS